MPTQLTYDAAVTLLSKVCDDMVAAKDELTDLDAALGDGDLGRTVDRGFRAIKESLAEDDGDDLGKMLYKQGKTFSNAAASSFGALMGTAFMQTGKALRGSDSATLTELVDAAQAAMDALMERGGAKVGDKTMLDALHPAIEAMRAALAESGEDMPLPDFLKAGAEAAQEGAEKTVEMQSQIGRASWQGERSIGQMDPGARAIAILLRSAAKNAE